AFGLFGYHASASKPVASAASAVDGQTPGVIIRIDLATNRMTVAKQGTAGPETKTTYPLAPRVKVFVDNNRESQLRDLPPRFTGSLTLTMEDDKVVEVMIVGVALTGTLAEVRLSEPSITLTLDATKTARTCTVAKKAQIAGHENGDR